MTAEGSRSLSICIASLGRSTLVSRTLPSVLVPGGSLEVEVLVVLSDEASEHLSFPDDERLVVIRPGLTAVGALRNKAVGAAKGDYLMFVDDDDSLAPDWPSLVADLLGRACGGLACGTAIWLDPEGHQVGESPLAPMSALHHRERGVFLSGTYVVSRDLFDRAGGYDESFGSSENWELAIRLLAELRSQGASLAVTDQPLLHYFRRPESELYDPTPVVELMLAKYADELADQPELRSDYHGQAGIAAVRRGKGREARRHFILGVRATPLRPSAWGRLLLGAIGPLARRRWPPVN